MPAGSEGDCFYGLDENGNLASDGPKASFKASPDDKDGAIMFQTRKKDNLLPLLMARKSMLEALQHGPRLHRVNRKGLDGVLSHVMTEITTTVNNATFHSIFARQEAYLEHLLREEILRAEEIEVCYISLSAMPCHSHGS